MTDVLEDLLVAPQGGSLSPPTPQAAAGLPRAPQVDIEKQTRPRIRWKRAATLAITAVVAIVGGLWIHERFVTGLVYDQRQRHLSADFSEPRPTIAQGAAVAVIQIPKISLNSVVIEGDSADYLRGAPAHRSSSAFPGSAGRTVILGHRRAYGGPFERLAELVEGDRVVVQGKQGPGTSYVVKSVTRGRSASIQIPHVRVGQSQLMLVTAAPGLFADDQLVVYASARATLPPGDAGVISLAPPDRGAPFGIQMLIANLSLALCVVVGYSLKHQRKTLVGVVVLAPLALLAVLQFLLLSETFLNPLR